MVSDAVALEGTAVVAGDVAGAVVAHQCPRLDAAFGKPRQGAFEEVDRAGGGQVVEQLGVGKTGMVIDHHMQVLVPGLAGAPAVEMTRILTPALADTEHPV